MIPDDPPRGEPGLETAPLEGRRALVLGLGRHNGGIETTRFLVGAGARSVVVADSGEAASLTEPTEAVRALGGEVVFGPLDEALLDGCDLVIASPAIPFEHPILAAAARRGLGVTTETNVFLARVRATVVGVTGTKGKSTTTSLLTSMLRAAGHRVHQGGNIGRPLIADLASIATGDRVVLELSSFQLWWMRRLERAPEVTVVTNLFPEHLDRHGTMAHYTRAKRAALDAQRASDVAVLPCDDPVVRAAGYLEAGRGRRILWGEGGDVRLEGDAIVGPFGRASLRDLGLLGAHNRRNALAAAAAASALLEHPTAAIERGLATTKPLPHRLEAIGTTDGVLYVDDSNSTHPEATIAALGAFDAPIVLIAGGKDKGADRGALLDAIRRRTKALVAIGSTGPGLAAGLAGHPATVVTGRMDEAIAAVRRMAVPGDVVLLSPGYSSLDQYASYADRGAAFRRAVGAVANGATATAPDA